MRSVPYGYARALELEGRQFHGDGQWGTTSMRLIYMESLPIEPEKIDIPVSPGGKVNSTPVELHSAFRPNRSRYYRNVRIADEAANLLDRGLGSRLVGACLPVFRSWATTVDGLIPMPSVGETPAPDTHAVKLLDVVEFTDNSYAVIVKPRYFRFDSSWGLIWGNQGLGSLPFDYYDKYVFEHWFQYRERHLVGFRHKWLDGNLGAWQARDEFDRRIYGFEIGDPDAERIGWAFAIETDGAIEVEELYVAHSHRRTGVATRLAARLAALAKAKGLPLRVWVSFADVASESPATVAALPCLARRMGVEFQRSPVRWAGYYATNEMPGSPTPVEPDRVPGRPKSTLGALAAFAAMGVGSPEPSDSPAPPPAALTVSTNGFHADADNWDDQNRRRIELIHKKWQGGGLNADEQSEFARLQAVARSLVAAALPPPLLTPAERAYVDSKAGH